MGNQGLNGGWAISDSGTYNFAHSIYQQIPAHGTGRCGVGAYRVSPGRSLLRCGQQQIVTGSPRCHSMTTW